MCTIYVLAIAQDIINMKVAKTATVPGNAVS